MIFTVSEINPYPVEALKDFHNYLDVETNLLWEFFLWTFVFHSIFVLFMADNLDTNLLTFPVAYLK